MLTLVEIMIAYIVKRFYTFINVHILNEHIKGTIIYIQNFYSIKKYV